MDQVVPGFGLLVFLSAAGGAKSTTILVGDILEMSYGITDIFIRVNYTFGDDSPY